MPIAFHRTPRTKLRPNPRSNLGASWPRGRHTAIPACLVLLMLWAIGARASDANLAKARDACTGLESKPLVVKIHADWCGSCRASAEAWAQVEREFAEVAQIVRFDVSDRPGHDAAREEASRVGLDAFFDEFRRRTGVIAFLPAGQQRPTTILTGERGFGPYVEALAAVCAKGEVR